MIISTKATYILLSLIGLLWGFQPITLKWLLPYWTPATITTFRFLVVGMVILFYQYFRLGRDMAKLLPRKTDWPWIVFMGINGQMLNSVLQFHGLQFTTCLLYTCHYVGLRLPAPSRSLFQETVAGHPALL